MQIKTQVRRALESDAPWIVALSARVQVYLTDSGSLQEIGPLCIQNVAASIQGGHSYLLEVEGLRIGSVLVEPLDGKYFNTNSFQHTDWGLDDLPQPLWFLQSFMLEPEHQGKGLGLVFLDGVLSLVNDKSGTLVLDCWAGNLKLRKFYESAGFLLQGDFPKDGYEIAVYKKRLGRSS